MMEGGPSEIERVAPRNVCEDNSEQLAPSSPQRGEEIRGGASLFLKASFAETKDMCFLPSSLPSNHQNDRWTALSLARRVTQPSSLASSRSKSSGFVK